jgi:hypothetical protein
MEAIMISTSSSDIKLQIASHEECEAYSVSQESKGSQTIKVIHPNDPLNAQDKYKRHACEIAKIAIPTLVLMGTLYLLTNYAVDEMQCYLDERIDTLNPQYQALISIKMNEATVNTTQWLDGKLTNITHSLLQVVPNITEVIKNTIERSVHEAIQEQQDALASSAAGTRFLR